ncbi:glycosyltransferase family protein [Rhizobium sp. SSA_523]|uniref:glycosyltransferase family protein n=1 Tax=Rhizobium sp. SSA_523 TaxID=2952477 RepID=UPI002090E878|nr:glycosyltransferase [Rhizobium sp. SSA_523]MCO5732360.1 glycosyl transferase [Rhizobium sp. SSA_523]WKC21242.1 glycosyltransferase [Rhizobium sp. SSA_523]
MNDTGQMRRRVFFYVQHLLGIGHLVRASRIAVAMQQSGLDVTMVTGGNRIEGFPDKTVRHVELPAILASNSAFSGLADAQGSPVDDTYKARRVDALLSAFHEIKPDAVLIEAFPFGRRQMRFELLPLLEAIRTARPRPLLFSSVRDILQENRKPGRDEETAQLVEDDFDGVLVHGDPAFVRLEDTFPLAARITGKVHYTGLVAPEPPVPAADRFDIVVSAGGGAVGAQLIGAAIEAQALLDDARSWCLITGPNLPAEEFDRLSRQTPAHVTLVRFRPDFPGLLANASISISQAGYNTVCDVLRTGVLSVLVPFASGGETEQTVRAQKLEAMGLAQVVREEELSGSKLARAVSLAGQSRRSKPPGIGLSGAQDTARLIGRLIEEAHSGEKIPTP